MKDKSAKDESMKDEAPAPKPSLGRIVIYQGEPGPCPAIVTAVHSADCVNLRIMSDSQEHPHWRTSVMRGSGPGQWDWPPRV